MEGRAIIFMSTNRLHFIDEAILRRAAIVLEFKRPTEEEYKELYAQSLKGLNLTDEQLKELAKLSKKEGGVGYSFSDVRLKVLPEAVALAYPDKPISFEILKEVINNVQPSPEII
jgi:SpoVK/Ycf46/Vps4 family AAA+-type ATPase